MSEAERRLYELVEGTDVEAVCDILKTRFNDETLTKALQKATSQLEHNDHMYRRFQICSKLLSAGAQITFDHKCQDSYDLIQHCCKYGNIDVLKQTVGALKRGVIKSYMNLFSKDEFATSQSPWSIAVRSSHIECIQFLYDYLKKKYFYFDLYPAIEYCAEYGKLASLVHLLKLHHCRYGRYQIFCIAKMRPNLAIRAFRKRHHECAKLLISNCSNVGIVMSETNNKDEWEFILTNATKNESLKRLVEYFLARKNWGCIHYILQERFVNVFEVDISQMNDGNSLLVNLIFENQVEIIEQLLKNHVNINSPCGNTKTPLEIAVRQYSMHKTTINWKITRILVSHGCGTDGYQIVWIQTTFPGLQIVEMFSLTGARIEKLPRCYWRRQATSQETRQKCENICKCNSTVVHPLKHLTRLSIRRALATSWFGTVPKLCGILPPFLINYLMMKHEIDDIETKYGLLDDHE